MRISDWSSDVCSSDLSTSKAALSALTREMAVEFAELNVRVNAVAPGEIETEMIGEEYDALIPRIPLHRMGRPDEVASTVFRLCPPDFGYVTGTELFVTGGPHLYCGRAHCCIRCREVARVRLLPRSEARSAG